MMLHLFRNMKFLAVFSLLMVLAFVSSETENKQKTLEELIKEESGRKSIEQPDIEEPRNQNVKTIDQLIEEELEREKTEPSFKKEKRDLMTGTWGGAVYTRWGRSECPSGSDIVYRGVAGGGYHADIGGGSNYICLPLTPEWGYYTSSASYGKVYGAEMENPVGFDLSNTGGVALQDSNVLCVVCRSLSRSSILMIPARRTCYNGWYLEYEGYLMTEHYNAKAQSDFICVDRSPEAHSGGYRNENGALMYNVEGHCGSLPCPPYVEGRELACVVCGN